MIIKCVACGESINVEGNPVDGQELVCPYCGKAFVYSKPKRIDLPTGLETARKIGIIRPGQGAESVDINAEALKRRMLADEQERQAKAAKEAALRSKAARELLMRNVLIWGTFATIVMVITIVIVNWHNKRVAREAALEAERARIERVESAQREQARLEAEREAEELRNKREAERRQREEQNRIEREEREKQRLAEQAEREKQRQAEQEAREQKQLMIAESLARYDRANAAFRNNKLLPWSSLPAESRPGKKEGEVTCVVMLDNGLRKLINVTTKSDGSLEIAWLKANGEVAEMSSEEYQQLIRDNGGLFLIGSAVYYLAPASNRDGWELKEEWFRPIQLYMHEAYFAICDYNLITDGVKCEVTFLNRKGMKEIFSIVKNGDENLSRYDVQMELENQIKSELLKKHGRPPRITVKMYDGNRIKQDGGVTLVPQIMEKPNSRYFDLRRKAEQQQADYDRWVFANESKVADQVRRQVDEIMSASILMTIKLIERK